MSIILNIGITLSFFLGIALFAKKNKCTADNIFAVWLIIIGIHLFSYSLYHNGYWTEYPHLIGITAPFPLLHGPFLYLYVLYSFNDKDRFELRDYLHFLPTLLSYLYMVPFFFLYTIEEKIQVDLGNTDNQKVFSIILMLGFIISGFSYLLLTYRKLNKYKKLLDDNFSSHTKIKLSWLKYSILFFCGMFVTGAFIILLREMLHLQFPFNMDIILYSFIVIFVIYIGYSGIRQQNLFADNIIDKKDLVEDKPESEYRRSGLKEDVAKSKHTELIEYMKNKKPYLNSRLTLAELAKNINISTNYLSQIINQYEKVNFYDFINTYRVEEFIKLAKENSNMNYLSIAFDSGFNSKSSFNSVFKKIKEVTPSQYFSDEEN